MISFSLVAQAIGLSGASGTRAGLCLLAVAVASHQGYVSLPQELAWIAHPGAMTGFGVILLFEMVTDRDEDARMLLGLVQYGLSAAGGALSVMASLGVATQGIPEWAIGGGGAALAVAMLALRRRVHTEFSGLENDLLHPTKWLNRAQEGGALALCVAVFVAPAVALAVVVMMVAAGIVAAVVAHRMEERLFRRSCPACGASIRVEASRCVQCRADVPVAKQLSLLSGLGTSAGPSGTPTRPPFDPDRRTARPSR